MGASALFRIFFKMESFFRFSLSSTRKTVFSGTRNAVFRKRSPERSFFENAGLSFLCGRTKTEAFENDHVIHVHLSYITVEGKGYYRMSFIISNCPVEGQKRGHTLHVYAYFVSKTENCYFYGLVISYSCLNNSRSLLQLQVI